MFDRSVELIADDIFHGSGIGEEGAVDGDTEVALSIRISEALIFKALKHSYPMATTAALNNHGGGRVQGEDEVYAMPEIDRINMSKEEVRRSMPLFPIQLDESTTKNNIEILRNIHVDQCKLPSKFFETKPGPVLLVGGDNKTIQKQWKISLTSAENDGVYDQHRHLLAVPGLFHTLMNFARGIIGVYYNGAKLEKKRGAKKATDREHVPNRHKINKSTLRRMQVVLNRKFVAPESTQLFTHQRSFIIDNFDGRVLALLLNALKLTPDLSRENIASAVSQITRRNLKRAIRKVAITMRMPVPDDDLERQVHMYFLRDAETFIVLRHAIKHGDVGLILRCARQMIVFFHGTNRWAYAHEMLYLLHVMGTDFSNKVAKKALQAALLVNPTGQPDNFYPIDLDNEQQNLSIKETWSAQHSSTSSVKHVTEYGTINGIFLQALSKNVIGIHGHPASGHHPPANRSSDIHIISREILPSILPKSAPSPDAEIAEVADDGWRPAPNVYALGMKKLLGEKGKLAAFNQSNADRGFTEVPVAKGDGNDESEEADEGEEDDVGTGFGIHMDADGSERVGDVVLDW
jgi:hypothetical protein